LVEADLFTGRVRRAPPLHTEGILKTKVLSTVALLAMLFGLFSFSANPALAGNGADEVTTWTDTNFGGTHVTWTVYPPITCDATCMAGWGLYQDIESIEFGSTPITSQSEIKLYDSSTSPGYGVTICVDEVNLANVPLHGGITIYNWANRAVQLHVQPKNTTDCPWDTSGPVDVPIPYTYFTY